MAVILLAGGRGNRLGGTEKALLQHRGLTLLEAWCQALIRRDLPAIVVGPDTLAEHLPPQMPLTREDPPFSGPAAAVCAGVRHLETAQHLQTALHGHQDPEDQTVADTRFAVPQTLMLLSVDTLDPEQVLDWLIDTAREHDSTTAGHTPVPTIIPQDSDGQLQMLTSVVDAAWLGHRVRSLPAGDEVGRPVRWLLQGASAEHPLMPAGLGADVDTSEDLQVHGVTIPRPGRL